MIQEICPVCGQSDWYRSKEKKFWTCKICEPENFTATEVAQENLCDHKKTCTQCGGQRFWQAKNSDAWKCETCQPPLSKAFVAARMGDGDHGIEFEAPSEASVVDEIELAMTVPWCPQCGCLRGTEKLYSDGRTETRCVRPACNALMPEWPLPLGPS